MNCERRRPRDDSPKSFIMMLVDSLTCERAAVYRTPMGKAMCAECALDSKEAHEGGRTIASIIQKKQRGEILEYRLVPIEGTSA